MYTHGQTFDTIVQVGWTLCAGEPHFELRVSKRTASEQTYTLTPNRKTGSQKSRSRPAQLKLLM